MSEAPDGGKNTSSVLGKIEKDLFIEGLITKESGILGKNKGK